ncbi:MAG: site-specific DNA-methyltransferase [Chitinispirillaceae bacterium]|nr:site-specific DNA-methyltransferase [Chitinispirillaceae bacterium]
MDNPTFETTHRIVISDARDMHALADGSVDLVVTSPPYPMIRMWDNLFSRLSPEVEDALEGENGNRAFELMHCELDKVWRELHRVLRSGSFACINIGDAVRTINGNFRLYSNHSRIIRRCSDIGFDCLPVVLWRKQTNAPNKFMGSGMLPAGAYVTLEHEYILIFRKGAKKEFESKQEKLSRMQSSFFWEERNNWFSDIWDFKGTRQGLDYDDLRDRSAAFPFELAWRLINMYSLYGDTVLDPFVGTGTAMLAAIASGRSSMGVDIDEAFTGYIAGRIERFLPEVNKLVAERIERHAQFVESRTHEKKLPHHTNAPHCFAVMTAQETQLQLKRITGIRLLNDGGFAAAYENIGRLETKEQFEKARTEMDGTASRQTTLDL